MLPIPQAARAVKFTSGRKKYKRHHDGINIYEARVDEEGAKWKSKYFIKTKESL
jgi:hypothetical protein